MQLLLDSHVFLWALNDSQKLGPTALALLSDTGNHLFVSSVSIWELGLKHRKGKLDYGIPELLDGIHVLGGELLTLTANHLQHFDQIELAHKDPFDTLLVAQCEADGLLFVTADRSILASAYNFSDAGR